MNAIKVGLSRALPRLSHKSGELEAALVGSTNTNVLYFTDTDDVTIGEGIAVVHSATLGSSFTISRRGLYGITFQAAGNDAGAGSVVFAISKNATTLVGVPAMSLDSGILASSRTTLALDQQTGAINLSLIVAVSAAEAAAGAVIRAHATDDAGAAPDIVNGSDLMSINLIADYAG